MFIWFIVFLRGVWYREVGKIWSHIPSPRWSEVRGRAGGPARIISPHLGFGVGGSQTSTPSCPCKTAPVSQSESSVTLEVADLCGAFDNLFPL